MNIATSTAPGRHITQRGYLLSALAAITLAASGLAPAQTTSANPESTLTRAQAKMDRDEFLKTHRYDTGTENWVLKSGVEAPAGVKSRAEIKAQRDEFLRNNRYDNATETWTPIKAGASKPSTKTRREVKEDTLRFVRTHHWDETTEAWAENPRRSKKK